jgi:large subunit ribosomal protein L25
MKSVSLNAFPRTQTRRGPVKKLRSNGRVPAVIYGRKHPSQSLEIETRALDELMKHAASENLLIDLSITDDPRPSRLALMQAVQHHALSGNVLHVDFHEVAADEKVTVMVPVETTGEAVGVKTGGGVLEHVLFKIKLRALPKDLPEVLVVDVSNMNVGDTIHFSELPVMEGVELIGDPDVPVIAVAAPKTEVAEAVEAADAALAAESKEPEVIKEKKTEEQPAAEKKPEKKPEKK